MRVHNGLLVLTLLAMLPSMSVCADAAPAASKAVAIGNGMVTLTATKAGSLYTGFDLVSGGKEIAKVRLSSSGLIAARECSRAGTSLRFGGLVGKARSGVEFGRNDSVQVSLRPNDPYPIVSFDLSLVRFDATKWQQVAGKQPFHFLCIHMPDAAVWHTRGWLNATPVSDPFPLLIDSHAGTPEISAYKYNRNWSYIVPLGADPLPVIGLWAPASRRYAAFEFETTRLADNSEKDVATGYCWGNGKDRVGKPNPNQFVSLVYPYGGKGYQSLVLPRAGSRIASHGVLVWSGDLDSTDDPNKLIYSYLWNRASASLPRVPSVVDLSWIPGGIRLSEFAGYPTAGALIGGQEKPFETAETRLIGGWTWHNESPTSAPSRYGDQRAIDSAKSMAAQLMTYAKRFKVGGAECVYWEKPLTGEWTPEFGGKAANSLHNANGFAAGRLFLGLYRDLGMTEYLPVVDGVLNWAKNVVWTRNEFADVPSSPFAIGGTLSASFCMDYYMTFKNAPDERHRNEARRALELARSFTYRYMTLWPSDSNRADNMDPSFLWEPNSGRDWTGAACSNEVFWNLDTLAQTAVHTGDPVLMWALQGSLNRWNLLYQPRYRDSLADYQPADMTEGYGLYDGNVYGVGTRATYGFASPLFMTEPIGSSSVRVLAGEKAAMAFNKNGAHTAIADYRCSEGGQFSFTVKSSLPSFDLSVTFPYLDISALPVAITRDGKTSPVADGDLVHPTQAVWSLMIRNVRDGDRVAVGEPDENGRTLPSAPPLTQESEGVQDADAFKTVSLPLDTTPVRDWSKADSWAGAPAGLVWYHGIPFTLGVEGAPQMATKPVSEPIAGQDSAKGLAVLYSRGDGPGPVVTFSDGSSRRVDEGATALAWRSWPPIFKSQLVVSLLDTGGKSVVRIDPGQRSVWAVTAVRTAGAFAAALKLVTAAGGELKTLAAAEAAATAIGADAAGLGAGRIALIPPSPAGPVIDLLYSAGLSSKLAVLSAEQTIELGYFTPKRMPVAIYAGGEQYLHSVRAPGDAADAIVKYVRDGGMLVLVSQQPWPMFYPTGPGSEGAGPLTPRLGIPIANSIEQAPASMPTLVIDENQNTLTGLPKSLPYPSGDPRLRSLIRDQMPANSIYSPIYRVIGKDGKDYGDAAGLIRYPGGGRVLYIWSGVLSDPRRNVPIVESVVRYIVDAAK